MLEKVLYQTIVGTVTFQYIYALEFHEMAMHFQREIVCSVKTVMFGCVATTWLRVATPATGIS